MYLVSFNWKLGNEKEITGYSKQMHPCLSKTQLKTTYRTKEFKEINWLPTKERAGQRVAAKIFRYLKRTLPFYVNELFVFS